ncbi:hypothetical protein ACMYSQ_002330 [Aspergillus niger]
MQTTSQRQGDCVSSQQAAGAFATSSDLFSRFSTDFRRPSSCVSVARRPPYRSTLDRSPDLHLPRTASRNHWGGSASGPHVEEKERTHPIPDSSLSCHRRLPEPNPASLNLP